MRLLLHMSGRLHAAASAVVHGTEGPAGSGTGLVTVTATGDRQKMQPPSQCSCWQSREGTRWKSWPPTPPLLGSEASRPGTEPRALGSSRAAVGMPALFLPHGSGPSVVSLYHLASQN